MKGKMKGQSGKLGLIIFYTAYIVMLLTILPYFDGSGTYYDTGGSEFPDDAEAPPTDIFSLVVFSFGDIFNRFAILLSFSINFPLLGIVNTVFTAAIAWAILEMIRGN